MHSKLWKRIGIATMAAGLAVTLGACGNSSAQDKNVKISILQGKVEANKEFKQIAKQYHKTHPNVTISVTSIGGGTQYDPVLKTRISSGNAPTIFSLAGPADVEMFKAHELDLSDMKAVKNALPGTLDTVKSGSKVVGLPFNLEGYGFVYNKEVFAKAGIDPTTLTTYDKLNAAVEKINGMKDELGLKGVFALPGKETWTLSDHLANLYLGQEYNYSAKKMYNSKTMKFTANQEMKQMIDLQKQYSAHPVLQMDYSTQVNQLFSQGKVAMIQQGDWIAPTIKQIDSDFLKNNVGMFPIPVKGQEGKMPVGVPNYWAINSKSDKAEQKAAKDFLNWLYTSKAGKKDVVNKLQFIPAYKGFADAKMADPLSQAAFDYKKANKTFGWAFNAYTGTSWDPDVFQPNLAKYLSGKQSWDTTVKNSTAGWKKQQADQ